MFRIQNALAGACLALASLGAHAQVDGTYTTGTGYTVDAKFSGNTLELYEPSNGKRSTYVRNSRGVYEFTNPVNGIAYTMEWRNGTLFANKPGAPEANGTTLRRVGTAGAATPQSPGEREGLERIANRYLERSQSDPANAQAWTFCGMAAMSRAQGGDSQAVQAAQALRVIANARSNPCPDAIPAATWNASAP
jgi:hypothetical protein